MRFVYVNWCVCVCSFNNRLKAEEENRLGLDRSSNQYHWDYSVVGASPPDGQPLSRSPATTVGDNWNANRSNSNSNWINRILKKKKLTAVEDKQRCQKHHSPESWRHPRPSIGIFAPCKPWHWSHWPQRGLPLVFYVCFLFLSFFFFQEKTSKNRKAVISQSSAHISACNPE